MKLTITLALILLISIPTLAKKETYGGGHPPCQKGEWVKCFRSKLPSPGKVIVFRPIIVFKPKAK